MCIQFQSVQGKWILWGPSCSPLNLEEESSIARPKEGRGSRRVVKPGASVAGVTTLPYSWATNPTHVLSSYAGAAGNAPTEGRAWRRIPRPLSALEKPHKLVHHGAHPLLA